MDAISIGPFALSTARALALGAAVAYLIGVRIASRGRPELRGLDAGGIIAALLVSRLFFVLSQWDVFAAEPLSVLYVWQGGFSAAGAVVGVLAWTLWYCRRDLRLAPAAALPAVAAAAIWLLSDAALEAAAGQRPELPPITMDTLEGDVLSLDDLRGRPVVLNVWATWCPPCRRELPMFAAAAAELDEVSFVFVNQGEPAAVVSAYLEARGLSLPGVVLGRGEITRLYGIRALPTTLFFDSEGHAVDSVVGELSRAVLESSLQAIMRSD